MAMNKSGQAIMVFIMVSIIVLMVAVIVSKPLLDQVTSTTGVDGLNCTNTENPTNTKVACVLVDMSLFYYVGILIAISIAFISGRRTITGVVTAIVVFIAVTVLITPLKDWLILVRGASYLNCSAAGISTATHMLCILFDLWLFYFFVAAIAGAITYIFMKKVVPEGGQ